MSITDIAASMQQIQLQLSQLNATTGSANPASASTFADALAGADGTATASAADATGASGSVAATATGTGAVTGQDVVQSALKYVGTPYVFGGESKSGMDCSGLVQRSFSDLGVSVPRLVHQQQTIGTAVPSLKDAKPGDLVVLNGGDHIAIWLGDGKVVHAPYAGRTVSVQKAWFTDKDVVTIRRVVPSEAAAPSATAATAATDAQVAALLASTAATGADTTGADSTDADSVGTDSIGTDALDSAGSADDGTSSFLSSLTASLGMGGTSSSSTAQQLLAARAAMLAGAA